ncbi:MAG: hypothetical protein IT269_08370, partial [Saprospiraceae bacterium]|nr:hypothetical protein [Saprospiraceae bacterium]
DFMYACALYPGGGRFLKNAAREAIEQIERLRQHPSVVLWCGNNENNEAWHHWGWQMQFTEAQRAQLWRDYRTMFNELLPTYVEQFSGGVPYWESSPKFGRGNSKSTSEGDSHYWGVWHDEEPFDVFNKKVPRFMSEFGFQSFPEWRTIESFTNESDRTLESKVMLAHQKHPRGNALIAEYMKRDYHAPKKFEDFVYVSQLLQAEGMRTGFEAHRRNKPYCMGTLYWQLNDVWPVASWSSIDCFGHWKALHYYAKEAFSPLAALPMLENDRFQVYGVNDKPDADTVTLRVRTMNFEGKVLSTHVMENIILKPDSSRVIWENPYTDLLQKEKPESCVTEIILEKGGIERYRRLFYAVPPKKMKLPSPKIEVEISTTDKGILVSILSDKLAKNVMVGTTLKGRFSNNYFDVLPGQKVSVLFTPDVKPSGDIQFTVKSLNELN